ncbi:hypothetical protein MCAV_06940 [[Mycoplasma] cavipharyngis]|uniref:DUF31 family putative serine protease n=1 Tax=[Mycoplasma] cavipharyngis TaxID=92757 RepID=UPI003704D2CC
MWKKQRFFYILVMLGTLVLSACRPADVGRAINPNEIFKTNINSDLESIDQKVYDQDQAGLAAPNPKDCQNDNIDICYYQYLNDRSFSIYKEYSKDDVPFQSSYGTAWIVDREVGTNNFYIATNIHVANAGPINPEFETNKPNPDIFRFAIGKQKLDQKLLNNNHRQITPASYQTVGSINSKNHADQEHRILTEVKLEPLSFTSFDSSPSQYNFILKKNQQNIDLKTKQALLKTIDSFQNKQWQQIYQTIENPQSAVFSLDNIIKFMFQKDLASNNFSKTNILSTKHKLSITANELKQFFKSPEEQEQLKFEKLPAYGFIDMATLKVSIPDDYLAANFPYFLNPKKYNQWTFPRFKQENILPSDYDPDINPIDFYHAGYPLEQIKKNLVYRSKGGPTFRVAKSTAKNKRIVGNGETLVLDNFACNPDFQYLSYCDQDQVPRSGIDILSSDDYVTGGGSSGSLVIDKDYNAVGIYWGIFFNRTNLVTKFSQDSAFQPLYNKPDVQDRISRLVTRNLPLKFVYGDQKLNYDQNHDLKPVNQSLIYALSKNLINSLSQTILDKFISLYSSGAIYPTDQTQFIGITRINDPATLSNIMENFVAKYGLELPLSNNTYNAITYLNKIKMGINHLLESKFQSAVNQIAYQFVNMILQDQKIEPILQSTSGLWSTNYGHINYKEQITNYFKKNNIHTYSLNPISI